MSERKSNTGRTAAIVGGGALLVLLLWRGTGWGLGGAGGGGAAGRSSARGAPCRVRIDADGVNVDGVRSDIPTTIASCQTAGSADVTATGAAIVGTIQQVVQALRDAGVDVRADPSIWDVVL